MIEGNCEKCGAVIHPGLTQSAFNRNRGLHMRKAHGIAGRDAIRYPKKPKPVATSDKARKAKAHRDYQRKYYHHRKALKGGKSNSQPKLATETPGDVIPCKVSECYNCGTRFYMVTPSQGTK